MSLASLCLRRPDAPPSRVPRGDAKALPRFITGLIFLLIVVVGVPGHMISAASPMTQFDGSYKGTIINVSAAGMGSQGGCDNSKIEQVMSISGEQVYLERKLFNPGASFILSGTITESGSISAAGVFRYSNIATQFYSLTGNVKDNEFKGELTSRYCTYSVLMKK